jgi:hypothetical protein
MKTPFQIAEQINDDSVLAPLQQHFSIDPPAELDQQVKQMFRDHLAQQQAKSSQLSATSQPWLQQLLEFWQLSKQTPAIAGTLVTMSLLAGVLSGLLLPSPWREQQQPIQPADTKMVLRNGHSSTASQIAAITNNAQLSAEQWLEIIAELLIQQRVEEAHVQLQAFRQRHPNLCVTGKSK